MVVICYCQVSSYNRPIQYCVQRDNYNAAVNARIARLQRLNGALQCRSDNIFLTIDRLQTAGSEYFQTRILAINVSIPDPIVA